MNFKNNAALDSVRRVVNEANLALNDKTRTIDTSDMSEVLGGALGAGAGGAVGFLGLYGLGTVGLSAAGMTSALAAAGGLVGGGMAAGVAVLAAPAVVLGIGATMVVSHRNKKKLAQAKEKVLQDAIKARDAVLRELSDDVAKSKERIDELTALNILLQRAVHDLQEDVRKAA